jgi:hypothetical protein
VEKIPKGILLRSRSYVSISYGPKSGEEAGASGKMVKVGNAERTWRMGNKELVWFCRALAAKSVGGLFIMICYGVESWPPSISQESLSQIGSGHQGSLPKMARYVGKLWSKHSHLIGKHLAWNIGNGKQV